MYRFMVPALALLASWMCPAAQAGVVITIDKASQQMTVEVDGATRWVWPVSTGRRGYETPAGSFKPFRLEEDHYSKEWDEAPMPHSIFFTMEGHAIHGSFETRNLGRRASHGCVRLAPSNAEKLFTLIKREGLSNARVVVREDPNAPMSAQRRTPEQEARRLQARRPALEGFPPGQMETFDRGQRAYGYPQGPSSDMPVTIWQTPQVRGPDWN